LNVYLNFLINKAETSMISREISLEPFRKIGNVDLSANSFAILIPSIYFLYYPKKD